MVEMEMAPMPAAADILGYTHLKFLAIKKVSSIVQGADFGDQDDGYLEGSRALDTLQ